ncbi:MAG: hypothetical protein QM640_12110 [Niabella sp.]
MNIIITILNNLDIIGPFLAIIIVCFRLNKLTPELKMILFFCVVQVLCNTTAQVFAYYKANNYWIYKVNTMLSFISILVLFTRYLLLGTALAKGALAGLFIAISFTPIFFGDGIVSYNSNSAALTSIVIVCYCLYYFYIKLIHSSPEDSAPSTPVFWCVVGLFTYYAGAFFIFISYKLLIEQDGGASVGTLWRFHNLLLFICSMYIGYGILCKPYQKISYSY